MKKLVLNTKANEWKWHRLLIRLVGTGHSYIQFGFEWESDGIVFYGIILVGTDIGADGTDEKVKVVISNRHLTVVKLKFIDINQLSSPEDFIRSVYFHIHQSKDKLI